MLCMQISVRWRFDLSAFQRYRPSMPHETPSCPRNRYEVLGVIASGGMGAIELARLHGPLAFTKTVAIKRLHRHFATDPAFVSMFIDEVRLSARLAHANIVPTLDVIDQLGELGLVMEYVHGESLAKLLQVAAERGTRIPVRVSAALAISVLHGLHAAHEACDDDGVSLGIVHRDVSPQNILVGVDGVPRILDFGVAKAAQKLHVTPSGEIKGKLAYVAPE
jgi:serine/threonine-protein kinase